MSLLLLFGQQQASASTGSLSATLGAVSLSAVGALPIQGSLSKTLGTLTLSASGDATVFTNARRLVSVGSRPGRVLVHS